MARNPAQPGPPPEDEAGPATFWSVNQLVSYNLLRARRAQGWTQQQLGEQLGQYTGRPWSNASVSAAERAYQGGRPRKFDLDEINAFCAVFDVPFAFFMLPPAGDFLISSPMGEADEEPAGRFGVDPVMYLRRILAVDPSPAFLERAQSASREHATLDFIPAKWEYAPPVAEPSEETVQLSVQAEEKRQDLQERLDLPESVIQALLETHSEEIATNVAVHLEKMGYLRNPELEKLQRELQDLHNKMTQFLADEEAGDG
ncbi:hypothetical protein [Streptomyces sp. DH12]|uniref:hypothetical protein n=1 Tax=Streptomyces sp. DH12 TaxID=2857010 RepID=UPI001E395B71|nr:hypothetical protein [Streptomyces sp. DH12]